MDSTDPVVTQAAPSGPRWFVPTILAIAVVGLLIALGSFGGSGTVTDTTEALAPTPPFIDPLETAVAVVEEFAAAWSAGDVEQVADLIADDWVSISLPGFDDPSFRPSDGREALYAGLAFIVPLADLDLGPCEVDVAAPASEAEAVVRCDEALLSGAYLEAVRRDLYENQLPEGGVSGEATQPGMWFGIDDGRIIALDDGNPHRYTSEAYCMWAELTHPDLADGLFDLSCRPKVGTGNIPVHEQLATAYLEAGAPLPSYEQLVGRLSASYLNRFVVHLNAGEPQDALNFVADGVAPSSLPGFAGAPADPEIDQYVDWSSHLMQWNLGDCTIAVGRGSTEVVCPDLTVTGPLVISTIGEPLAQPTRFTVRYSSIIDAEALSDDDIDTAVICRRLGRLRPTTAASTFTESCTPIYTGQAAEVLLTVLEGGYTAEG